jgi:hypothetical protein
MAELIEVTRMPQILMTASEEIATGARLLREQLALRSGPRAG